MKIEKIDLPTLTLVGEGGSDKIICRCSGADKVGSRAVVGE